MISAPLTERLRLRPGVEQSVTPTGDRRLTALPCAADLGPDSTELAAVLRLLDQRPYAPAELPALSGLDGARLDAPLARLRAGGWLIVELHAADGPLYTLHPARLAAPMDGPAPRECAMSRLAVVHRDDDGFVIESPRSWCDVRVHDPAVLGYLAGLPRRPDDLPPAVAKRLLADLWSARLLVAPGDAEETELRLRQWSPFELWMHNRSRLGAAGRFNDSWGATGWAEGEFDPLPARREPFDGPAVDLYRPDLDVLRTTDPSLTGVLEDRRSVRDHDQANPITVDQLGEFLYRCARVRAVEILDGVEHLDRPFPSGGALHELELYPVVRNVVGLGPGLYHYDGHDHRLRQVCGDTPAVRRLLATAEQATFAEDPQLAIVISARFGRLMWKYAGMGYAAILKNVGALYQVMYAVATAMRLAPCGVGGGDAATFNDATGVDYFAESVVGEFLLGSRAVDG